jgi:hypothetical protein
MNTTPEPPRENALPTPYDLRARLERAVLADLLGPANGPEEMVEERYLDRAVLALTMEHKRCITLQRNNETAITKRSVTRIAQMSELYFDIL